MRDFYCVRTTCVMIGPWTAYPGLNHGGTCAICKRSCSVVYLFVCAVMVREIQHALPSVIESCISLCLSRVFLEKLNLFRFILTVFFFCKITRIKCLQILFKSSRLIELFPSVDL